MPEPNVLYAVTAVVVASLVAWVVVVLRTAKEPWARPFAESESGAQSSVASAESAIAGTSAVEAPRADASTLNEVAVPSSTRGASPASGGAMTSTRGSSPRIDDAIDDRSPSMASLPNMVVSTVPSDAPPQAIVPNGKADDTRSSKK